MSSFTTREAPPEVVPDTMRIGLSVGLGEGVDGRVRADEGGVDAPAEEGLTGLGAGVEGRVGHRGGAVERIVEEALLDRGDRGSVGHVREVPEAELGDLASATVGGSGVRGGVAPAVAVIATATGSHEKSGQDHGEGEAPPSGSWGVSLLTPSPCVVGRALMTRIPVVLVYL